MDINEVLEELAIDKNRIQQTFSGNMTLYKRFLVKFVNDPTFTSLCDAVDSKDLKAIEIAAHTLKGITGNLGLDSLFNLSTDILACARNGNESEIPLLMNQGKEEYNRIIPYIQKIV